ncbi:MAG: RsmE family RNA methyltransferase [Phycisphaerales bacterium]|nr:RsmE family RNA methyltransferase [Phycisphaerales bacterium]
MASLPFFYQDTKLEKGAILHLSDDTAKHIVQVLRKRESEQIIVNNGRGDSAVAILSTVDKKKCIVKIQEITQHQPPLMGLHLCVGFTKNTSRNEWLLEKATELGVRSITPIQASRTEKEKHRVDRWQNIMISAMLQSQQYFLPELKTASKLDDIFKAHTATPQKLIAHCASELERSTIARAMVARQETLFLIGPEGDFTVEEINLCLQKGFKAISLCAQRLRTETAAMAVCAYFNLLNHE